MKEIAIVAERPRPRYLSLQAGRGLAALLVVVNHVYSFVTEDPRAWHHPVLFSWLAAPQLRISFFFVLSGIVIFTAHSKDIGDPSAVPSYLWKRFRRIYPIYWLVLALVLCSQLTSHDPTTAYQRNPLVVLSSVLLVHIGSAQTNLAPAWTLFHEIMFYAVFAVLLLHKRAGTALFGLWMLLSVVSVLHASALLPNLFAPFHLLFGFGMVAAWLIRERKVPRPALLLALGCLIFAGSIVYAGWIGESSLTMYLSAGVGSALALIGAAELEIQTRLKIPSSLVFLGNASYSIYLIHVPVVSAVARLSFWADTRLHWPLSIWMLVMFATATASGCLLHIFIERPLRRWRTPAPKLADRMDMDNEMALAGCSAEPVTPVQ